MRISTKGRGIIKAQQGTVARPNPKENYKLPEDQRYQAQTRGMKDFAIEWYKERAKQPKYQSQVNESNLANITDQINRAEYVEPSKFYSNPNVYKGKVGNVTQAAQVAMRQNKGAKIPSGFNTLSDDEIAKLHNTFASNANNKRSNTMLIAKRGVQIKRRIIK